MKRFSLLVFAIISVLAIQPLFSQSNALDQLKKNAAKARNSQLLQNSTARRDQQLFRSAQSYMNMNRYDNAISILEDLLRRNPTNEIYYQWLLRAYLTISRTQSADSLVSIMIKREPQNYIYQIDRAKVLFQQDKREEAQDIWNRILQAHPGDMGVYNQVANAMLQNRLSDDAIAVYEQAIRDIPNAYHLYQNIAAIYQSRLMYAQATRNYLKYLEKQPEQRAFIFNRILSFQLEPEERPALFKMLEDEARKSKQSTDIHLLMAQLYQRYRDFDKAFEIYQQLENEESGGNYLLQFARAAELDSSYNIALQTYRIIIDKQPGSKSAMVAYSGAVTTLFSLAKNSGNTSYADEALKLIETVQSKFPTHPDLARLSYLKGVFYLDYFFDVDRAADIFSDLTSAKSISNEYRDMAALKLGECYLIRGQLGQALATYQNISQPGHQGEALLQTAQTYYFMKDWEKAGDTINRIIQKEGLQADVTNNALELQMRMSQVQSLPEVRDMLSEADLLVFQRKKSEAIKKFSKIVQTESVPPLVKSDAYSEMTRLALELKEFPQALDFANSAIRDSSLSNYADEHLFMLASIMDKQLNRPADAFKIYQQLLEDYPNSLFVDQARERMRNLREQKPTEIP